MRGASEDLEVPHVLRHGGARRRNDHSQAPYSVPRLVHVPPLAQGMSKPAGVHNATHVGPLPRSKHEAFATQSPGPLHEAPTG